MHPKQQQTRAFVHSDHSLSLQTGIMQTNIIWTGLYYHSLENCLLKQSPLIGNDVKSTIIGYHNNHIYKIDYQITTTENWEPIRVIIRTQVDDLREIITLKKLQGKYVLNGKANSEFDDITDIDISLTPFTNSLPINRLKLKDKERQVIDVLYFDLLEKVIRPVKQVYTKLSNYEYVYENYDKSFQANIIIDEEGLIVDYPGLFAMKAKVESNYNQDRFCDLVP